MRHARQRQSQVWGVHGRGSSGLGQHVQRRPLPNPDPGGMVISPGRRAFRPLTRCHRPWPGCQAPTNPLSRRARPGQSRIAVPPYSAGGQACRARSGCGGEPKAQRPAHPRRGAPDRPALSCPVRVGLARPTKQVVDGSLRAVLAAGRRPNGPVRRLKATSMTSNGNQVRVLDPVDGRPSGFRRR